MLNCSQEKETGALLLSVTKEKETGTLLLMFSEEGNWCSGGCNTKKPIPV